MSAVPQGLALVPTGAMLKPAGTLAQRPKAIGKRPMPIITIDNRDYDLNTLSDEVKQQINNLQGCEQEIAHLTVQLAIAQTAKATYARALQEVLPRSPVFRAESVM